MRAGADTAEWYELRFVDVGGCRLALRDAGQGEPVVVLEMGLGAGGAFYDDIARAVSAFTRVVWYDRAGLGQSDLAPTPRTIADLTRDLQALLRAARIPGPYVLVGHSLGGLTVRFYQHRHPREVAALVLIDAAHEEQRERLAATLPPAAPGEHAAIAETRHSLRVNWADPAMNAEGIDNIANSSLMRGCGDLGDLPLVVVSRGRPSPAPAGFPPELIERREQAWRHMQRELARLSSRGAHIIADRSGHLINKDQPELVVESIRRAVALVQGRA